jgi:uncharacterized protein
MIMKIFITGGTGFIGSALTRSLIGHGYKVSVLSRNPDSVLKNCDLGVIALGSLQEIKAEDSYDVIVNLAGAPIIGARWTESRKKIIRDSRIGLTDEVVTCIGRMTVKPKLLISGSAIGYYGEQSDAILTEKSAPVTDFSQTLCADWEAAAKHAEQYGVRVCLVRTGLVIGQGGGLLQRMSIPFRLGLGGRLGSGKQWMSWIHLDDWIRIANTMITDTTMQGAYNATAPKPVTNQEFTEKLAQSLKRPSMFPVPEWLLKILLGEMSQLVLGSQRVVPERLLAQGFTFQYNNLADALDHSLSGSMNRL